MGVLGVCVNSVRVALPWPTKHHPLILACEKRILCDSNGNLSGAQVARRLLAASPTQTKHLAGGVACHVFALNIWAARMRPYHPDVTHSAV
jgi:hypothetical protein